MVEPILFTKILFNTPLRGAQRHQEKLTFPSNFAFQPWHCRMVVTGGRNETNLEAGVHGGVQGTSALSPHCSEAGAGENPCYLDDSPAPGFLGLACQWDFCGAIDACASRILRRNCLERFDSPGGNPVARSAALAYTD